MSNKHDELFRIPEGTNHELLAVLDAAPVGIMVFNDEERIIYANPSARQLFGSRLTGPGEIRCGDFIGCAHRHEDPRGCGYTTNCPGCRLFQAIRSALFNDQPDPVQSGDAMIERESGLGSIWVKYRASRVMLGDRRNVILAMDDISENKKTEDALRISEARYRALFMHHPVQTVIVDNEGKIVMYNFSKTKADGRLPNIGDVMYRDYAAKHHVNMYKELMECIRSSKPKEFPELKYNERFLNIKISPFSEGAIITANDITEMKRLNDQLRQAQKMEAMGTLAGGIAHEFNNLIGIILGNTELALDDLPQHAAARDYLLEIRNASFRARDVVRQIMSFARKTPALKRPIKIGPVVRESLKLIRSTIPANIEIRQEILCDSEMILGNPTEINQILMNLFNNSLHAIEAETGTLEIRLEPVFLDDISAAGYEELGSGKHVRLNITDTGQGIRPEHMSRIFDPYFTTKDVSKGLGMGLAVVYGIVKKNDGAIKILSEVGKGTTVEVLFPLIEARSEPEEKEIEGLPTGKERILFVDDEVSMVRMVSQVLERQGYGVVGLTSSKEALKLFQTEPGNFDLIITDIAMPDMPGDILTREILRIRPDMPVILSTGYSDRIDEKKAGDLGAAAYTKKPMDKKELAKTVREVLDKAVAAKGC